MRRAGRSGHRVGPIQVGELGAQAGGVRVVEVEQHRQRLRPDPARQLACAGRPVDRAQAHQRLAVAEAVAVGPVQPDRMPVAADCLGVAAEKAKNGGTVSRAPLGYLNVTVTLDDRTIRTVETDAVRAPLIAQAFELFGTGQYTGAQVLEQVTLEAKVAQHYDTVRLSPQFQEELRGRLDDAMLTELSTLAALRKAQAARVAELDAKEDQFLDLIGSPGWPPGQAAPQAG